MSSVLGGNIHRQFAFRTQVESHVREQLAHGCYLKATSGVSSLTIRYDIRAEGLHYGDIFSRL